MIAHTRFSGYSPDGLRTLEKGGGGKGVLGIVAAIAIPFAAPALAGAMGMSGAISTAMGVSATMGSTIGGALVGGAMSSVMGNGFASGALGGGLGGFSAGSMANVAPAGVTEAVPTAVEGAGIQGASGIGTGVGGSGASSISAVPGGMVAGAAPEAGLGATGGYSNIGSFIDSGGAGGQTLGGSLGGSTGASTLDAGVGGATGAPVAGLNTSGVGAASQPYVGNSISDLAQTDPNGAVPQYTTGDAVKSTAMNTASKIGDTLTNPDNLARAGIQLGAQAIGAAIGPKGPDLGSLNSYIDNVKNLQTQANNFNLTQATKKSATADQVVATAENYDPQYFAGQQRAGYMSGADSRWKNMEQTLRAQGYDDNYINAMKQQNDLGTSTGAATAYDQGWQSGQNMRQSGLAQGAGLYTGTTVPTAGLTADYTSLYNTAAGARNSVGTGLENAFLPQTTTTKKVAGVTDTSTPAGA